jgi:hypothetical protein
MKTTKPFWLRALSLLVAASLVSVPASAGVSGKKINDGAINAKKLSEPVRKGHAIYEMMDHQPMVGLTANGYADPTSAGPNTVVFRNGLSATYTGLGTQTILGPVFEVTKGLNISQDQTDDDGVQYTFGALGTLGAWTHTVGTDADKYLKISFEIADVSGTDDCLVGWRKNEAVQANVDDYDEMAAVNVILGDVKVETILNNAATTTTDSTQNWADGETHTIEVRLVGRLVAYYLDGAPLSGIPTYQFDSGEVVVPFFFFLQATTSPGKVWWKYVEIGTLNSVNANASDDSL